MMELWIRAVIRHRLIIIAVWIALVSAGVFASANIDQRLTTSLEVPGSQSAQADQILATQFDENIQGTFTAIYKFKTSTPAEIEGYKSSIVRAAGEIAGATVVQQRAMGGILIASITTPFSLLDAAAQTEGIRAAIENAGLQGVLVTGPPAINHDVSPVLANDLQRGQLVAIAVALFLLILMLGFSIAVIIPIIFALASISLAIALVYLLADKMLMVLYIPNIVELIGLGLAIDYSLLLLHRYRSEVRKNSEGDINDAVLITMATAGRTILISGTIVCIALATLLLVPVPFVQSLGTAGLIVPMTSMLATVTLAPAILSVLGKHAVSTIGFSGLIGRKDVLSGAWAKIARLVISKPKTVFFGSLLTLAIMASSIFWLAVTPSSLTAIPSNLESSQALSVITNRAGPGVITPHELVIDLGADGQADLPNVTAARINLANTLSKNSEIFIVATDNKAPFVDAAGRFIRIFVVGQNGLGQPESDDLVKTLRAIDLRATGFTPQTVAYLGGAPAQGVDLIEAILQSLPWIIVLALLLTYILLTRALRSLILPIKAIALDLISIVVAFASLVAVFRFGFASSILQTYRLDQIEVWALIFLGAVLFGLSMDYEIFLVSRMREARDKGATNNEAIIAGFAQTGVVVSAAAIIFVSAMSGFVMGHFAGLQQLGVGLGVGVLIDATIIRGLLLPSTMVLLGRWNWWLPAGVARLLKTKASPLDQPEVRL
jgi:RND superfamily putative drug exporter